MVIQIKKKTILLNSLIDYRVSKATKSIVIVGDYNLPDIDWTVPVSNGNSSHDSFLNTCLQNNLEQLVTEPTRGINILDLILTNDLVKFINFSICEP